VKVAHVNFIEGVGGAYAATVKLAGLAKSIGQEVQLVYVINSQGEWNSAIPTMVKFRIRLNHYLTKLLRMLIQDKEISPVFIRTGFGRYLNSLDCDLIHLHWVAGGLMSTKDLLEIQKDIVVSVHDTWILNGLFHTRLVPSKSLHRIYSNRFVSILKRIGVTYCVTTNWMAQQLKSSDIFSGAKIVQVQIPLDNAFTPKTSPVERKTRVFKIGLGSVNVETDLNKGYHFVLKALNALPSAIQNSIELHLFGTRECGVDNDHFFTIVKHGYIQSPALLENFYRDMDLQLLPSSMEMFGQVACEALQCGTPVLISDRCGVSDHVKIDYNGKIYKCGDIDDFNTALMDLMERGQCCPKAISLTISEDFNITKLQDQLASCYAQL
jgi:glycosyltransferase involved in cell wall biosynthesis